MRYEGTSVRQRMGTAETALHMVMIICTCGVWYLVYRSRKNKIERTTRHYA
jgi:cbb3-type cytochrome oxidase subunit 3